MKKSKRIATLAIIAALLLCMIIPMHAQPVTAFSDVPNTYWGYETIMDMTEYGLFKGTSNPVNGIGVFSPEKTMTKAEFITVAMRATYPTESEQIGTVGSTWWSGFYKLAADNQVISNTEMDAADMSRPITRAEMAMIMVRCLRNMGEYAEKYVSQEQIADFSDIPMYYKEYVLECFSMGLLCGIDQKGTFAPEKSLTRAEAATVICRFVDKDTRIDVDFPDESGEYDKNYEEERESLSDFVLMSTPIGDLYYLGEWQDKMRVEENTSNKGYNADVYGVTGNGVTKLYTIYIGDYENVGWLIGYVDNNKILIDVDDLALNGWMEADKSDIYAMQDSINYIMDQISEMEGYVIQIPDNDASNDDTTVVPEKHYDDFMLLNTPVGKLYFTERWEDYVITKELNVSKGYVVEVLADTDSGTAKLYVLYIGTGTTDGFLIGYVNGSEVRVDVSELNFDSKWSEVDEEIAYIMQEDLGCIVDQITEMHGFTMDVSDDDVSEEPEQDGDTNGIPPEGSYGEFELLNTPVGKLYFTERWEDYVVTKELNTSKGYAVEISTDTDSGTAKLYVLHIGTGITDGYTIGYVDGDEVRIDVPELILSSKWTEADTELAYTMQEDLNCIIDQIMKMDGFSTELNNDIPSDGDYGEFLLLNTPVGKLYFTERWEDYVVTKELNVSKGYSVEISADTTSGTAKLFMVYIGTGTSDGYLIGTVNGTEVRVDLPELNFGSKWSEADVEIAYTMQEDLNCIIDQIMEIAD